MAKSVRSKFKKANKRIRVADERRNVLKRVTQLNAKLKLVQKGGISKVPSEEPEKRFHFGQPVVNAKERMTLPEMTTNPYGKSDASAPHPTTFNFEKLPGWMPAGGKSMSFADRDKLEAYQQQLALAAAAAAASEHGNVGAAPSDDDDDGPMEITIGMNDDEHLTTRNFKPAGGNKLKSMTHQKNEHSGAKKMPASGAKKRMVSSTGIKKK
eukprot:GILI01004900.1.p1 GENE.GILI01004900.1~~GILI01004900.1.p1  ORF type:complete len:233 (+),score=69.97 GILI01004900.1:67-699(+)